MPTTYREKQKLERLKLTYEDKYGVAQTMRQNLASDIKCGYGLANVVRQMVAIEDYEKKVVAKAKQEYEDYAESLRKKTSRLYPSCIPQMLVWKDNDIDE